MCKGMFLLSLIMVFNTLLAQDQFEGIIVYHRTSPEDTSTQGIVTAYFKGYKHKIVSQFVTDTSIEHYTSYFNFEKYPNTYFKRHMKSNSIEKINFHDQTSILPHEIDSQNVEYIKGYPCFQLEYPYDDGITKSTVTKYLSKNHRFKLPDNTSFDGFILSQRHAHIPLKMIENSQYLGSMETFTIVKEAVLIIPIPLPDGIFEFQDKRG